MASPVIGWVRRQDPDLRVLRTAIKIAVVVCLSLAITTAISDDPQQAIFAAFGGVALMLFVEFPGNRPARLAAYVVLTVVGALLIVLGTLASRWSVTAVAGMAVVGFLVSFAGVLSSAAAAATQAALLTFVLPVAIPATPAEIQVRLLGWGIAAVLAIPVAVFVWPPTAYAALRAKAAAACHAVAAQLLDLADAHSDASPVAGPETGDRDKAAGLMVAAGQQADADTEKALLALRTQLRHGMRQPGAVITGSRLLGPLVEQLSWLRGVSREVQRHTPGPWADGRTPLVRSCAQVLEASAQVLVTVAGSGSAASRVHRNQQLSAAVSALDDSEPRLRTRPRQVGLLHELLFTTRMVGHTVAISAAADGRSLVDRLTGRRHAQVSPIAVTGRTIREQLTPGSIWFQNSIRAALGLAVAVLLIQVTHVSHGFWVVLGTMSVLRTTALATEATALRALTGTLLGFLVGAAVLLVIGTDPLVLWAVLPLAVLAAAFASLAGLFVAAQAAFTIMVVILFNIIEPVGWSVGLVRVVDVALGTIAGLLCGFLVWPRGAPAQIREDLALSYAACAEAFVSAVHAALRPSDAALATATGALSAAHAANGRLDGALRSLLAGRVTDGMPLHELNVASNGVTRVRLVAAALTQSAAIGVVTGDPPVLAGLTVAGQRTGAWYRQAGTALEQPGTSLPPADLPLAERHVLDAFAAIDEPAAPTRGVAREAETSALRGLWDVALHLDAATRLEARLKPALDTLAARRDSK